MNFKEWLATEDFNKWNSGMWIHYSKEPYIKINYNTMWKSDPLGIFLFPEDFEKQTVGNWHSLPYKFKVKLKPNIKILDLANISKNEIKNLANKAGLEIEEDDPDPSEKLWSGLKGWANYNPGKFNTILRKSGYDAVFDDNDIIYPQEVQLVVLNPTKIEVVDMERRGGSGYAELQKVTEVMKKLLSEYGEITITRPKMKKDWGSNKFISTNIYVNEKLHQTGPYASWKIRTEKMVNNSPEEIWVKLDWSNPSRKANAKSSGWGNNFADDYSASITIPIRYMHLDVLNKVKLIMDQIWAEHEERTSAKV